MTDRVTRIEVHPTELLPGDVVLEMRHRDPYGCRVQVLVERASEAPDDPRSPAQRFADWLDAVIDGRPAQ
jgi:hypothetical protein